MRPAASTYLGLTGAAVLALLLIFALADTGNLGPVRSLYAFPHGDRVGHFVLYGGVTVLATLAVSSRSSRSLGSAWLAATASVTVLAAIEELSQLWLSSRSAGWTDFGASLAGIAFGSAAGAILRRVG